MFLSACNAGRVSACYERGICIGAVCRSMYKASLNRSLNKRGDTFNTCIEFSSSRIRVNRTQFDAAQQPQAPPRHCNPLLLHTM